MIQVKGKISEYDLIHVIKRFGMPIAAFPAPKEKTRIAPHVSRFLLKSGDIIDVIHVKPIYYEHLNESWYPLSEVLEYHGNKTMILKPDFDKKIHPRFFRWLIKRQELLNSPLKIISPYKFKNNLVPIREGFEIFFTTTIVYPDPNPESTSVDGNIISDGSAGAGWDTTRAGTNLIASDTGSDNFVAEVRRYTGASAFDIYRGYFLFDTGAVIPDTDTVSAAVLTFKTTATKFDDINDAFSYFALLTTTPASNTAITTGDWGNIGTTKQAADVDITGISTSSTFDMTLNATGRSNISLTGISKFGVRTGNDLENSAPGGDNTLEGVSINFADAATEANDPKLTITHAGATSTKRLFMLMGMGQ